MAIDLRAIVTDGYFSDTGPEADKIFSFGYFEGLSAVHVGYFTDGWFWTDGTQPSGEEIYTFGFYTGVTTGGAAGTGDVVITYYYRRFRNAQEAIP
jgi:hypothetical protein